jgi:hypothetical protein
VTDAALARSADDLLVGGIDVQEEVIDRPPSGIEDHLEQRRAVVQ